MTEDYSDWDERLNIVIDEINYQNQRKIGVNRTIPEEYPVFEQLDLPIIERMGK